MRACCDTTTLVIGTTPEPATVECFLASIGKLGVSCSWTGLASLATDVRVAVPRTRDKQIVLTAIAIRKQLVSRSVGQSSHMATS